MEAEIKVDYPGSEIELIKGSGGIFDIICDGKMIYSKLSNKEQRFPKDGEITALIKQRM